LTGAMLTGCGGCLTDTSAAWPWCESHVRVTYYWWRETHQLQCSATVLECPRSKRNLLG